MLELDFYYRTPIDFEYKNYILLDYLSQLDKAFSLHNLSPYLLHTEKLISELDMFKFKMEILEKDLKKDIIGFSWQSGIIYSEINNSVLKEIIEIVDYSKPLLEVKIKMGYKLFEKYPQILY